MMFSSGSHVLYLYESATVQVVLLTILLIRRATFIGSLISTRPRPIYLYTQFMRVIASFR